VAGQNVPRVVRAEAGSVRSQNERRDKFAGWLAHERRAVPVFLRPVSSRVERVPTRGGEPAVMIDLPHLVAERFDLVLIRDAAEHTRRPAAHLFVVAIRDWHELA